MAAYAIGEHVLVHLYSHLPFEPGTIEGLDAGDGYAVRTNLNAPFPTVTYGLSEACIRPRTEFDHPYDLPPVFLSP